MRAGSCGCEARGPRLQLFPECARPLAARARNRVPGTEGLGCPLPAEHRGRPQAGVILPETSPGVEAPALPSLPKLLCPLAPRPRVPGLLQGSYPGVGARWPHFAGAGRSFLPFPWPGSLAGGGGPARGPGFSERLRAPRRKRQARADARRAAERGGREGEELVIARRGTIPTFEPLTTKQTTLGLSLHSKQGLLTGVSQQRIATAGRRRSGRGSEARAGSGRPSPRLRTPGLRAPAQRTPTQLLPRARRPGTVPPPEPLSQPRSGMRHPERLGIGETLRGA